MITGIIRSGVKHLRYTHRWHQPCYPVHVSSQRMYSDHVDVIAKAKLKLDQLTEDPGNEAKLKLYSLYKQATIGPCNTKKPGMFDLVGQAKWNAWNQLGELPQMDAAQQYSQYVTELVGEAAAPAATSSNTSYQDLLITDNNGIRTVTFNRPTKYNAFNFQMYKDFTHALNTASSDNAVKAAMITGAGKYYSSGNDITNFTKALGPDTTPQQVAAESRALLREFVDSLIDFPKPLVAAVNGPAVGIMVTTLSLCDLIYCCESATFHTPFMELGLSPEGCSAFMFPKIMGYSRANEVLLLGRKMTAAEAYSNGLVTRVFPDEQFENEIKGVADRLASLPPKSLSKTKQIIRGIENSFLKEVNEKECALLEERWLSEECLAAVMKFMERKSS